MRRSGAISRAVGAYAECVLFGKGVGNCDEVRWSGLRSSEVAKGCGRS